MEIYLPLFATVAKSVLLSISGLSFLMGCLAIVRPRGFAAALALGNRWIDTWKLFGIPETSKLRALDRWVDLDGYALRYSRPAGVVMCLAASFVGYLGLTMA